MDENQFRIFVRLLEQVLRSLRQIEAAMGKIEEQYLHAQEDAIDEKR